MSLVFILMRVQIETKYPRPSCEASESFRVGSEAWQAVLQWSDDGIQVVEHRLGEFFLAQLIPDMLLRVQLRRVGRQGQQANIFREAQLFGLMRTGAIPYHHDELGRMGRADLQQELRHA